MISWHRKFDYHKKLINSTPYWLWHSENTPVAEEAKQIASAARVRCKVYRLFAALHLSLPEALEVSLCYAHSINNGQIINVN